MTDIQLFLRYFFFLCFGSCILLSACMGSRHNETSVKTAMQQYDRLILKLDADSIALLYTPDGNLGDIAVGRDSIRRFLSSFKNITVLSQSSTTTSIQITKDTAVQKGTYTQSDLVNKDTLHVKGEYIATWQWLRKDGWHIKRMVTKPVN
jgi:hypothetical protein